jgi:hypothetical protein
MPKRAYKASIAAYNRSVGHASTHIWDNLVVWMAVCAVVTGVAAYLVGHPAGLESQTWGHITAAAGMFLGVLVMMWAELVHA